MNLCQLHSCLIFQMPFKTNKREFHGWIRQSICLSNTVIVELMHILASSLQAGRVANPLIISLYCEFFSFKISIKIWLWNRYQQILCSFSNLPNHTPGVPTHFVSKSPRVASITNLNERILCGAIWITSIHFGLFDFCEQSFLFSFFLSTRCSSSRK